ncbi:MAG: hypothetical protein [Caudoviricetes sp.]|nr:MAG: hypothetical protein [Caudoviricetes sp.]
MYSFPQSPILPSRNAITAAHTAHSAFSTSPSHRLAGLASSSLSLAFSTSCFCVRPSSFSRMALYCSAWAASTRSRLFRRLYISRCVFPCCSLARSRADMRGSSGQSLGLQFSGIGITLLNQWF